MGEHIKLMEAQTLNCIRVSFDQETEKHGGNEGLKWKLMELVKESSFG